MTKIRTDVIERDFYKSFEADDRCWTFVTNNEHLAERIFENLDNKIKNKICEISSMEEE